METEKRMVHFVCGTRFEDLPQAPLDIIKKQILTVLGTTIAGAAAEGCEKLVRFFKQLGGKKEATILIHGGRIPAQDAAFLNGMMARALDFCDAMAPGIHIGSSIVPAALACAELAGGISGKEFLAAIAVGSEVSARMNLSEDAYNGLDPTGVCVVFAATTAAARILHLGESQTRNALALAFNRCGGSFQSNVDGSLAVRVIQGWVAQTGVTCARFALEGITGPRNFLEGIYGYFNLYGKGFLKPDEVGADLGKRFELEKILFKKYPSCGLTLGCTEVILKLMEDTGIGADDIERIDVTVPPYTYKLVGHPFKIGDNPKVNAQFSIQYCIANALLRKKSKLEHFEEASIRAPRIADLVGKIHVIVDEAMTKRGHTPLDMHVLAREGKEYFRSLDIAPGFPGRSLTTQEHGERFQDCLDFARNPLPEEKVQRLITMVDHIEEMKDVQMLVPLLIQTQ